MHTLKGADPVVVVDDEVRQRDTAHLVPGLMGLISNEFAVMNSGLRLIFFLELPSFKNLTPPLGLSSSLLLLYKADPVYIRNISTLVLFFCFVF